MVRISEWAKSYENDKGEKLTSKVVVDFLGTLGHKKTASSNLPEEVEKDVIKHVQGIGFHRIGSGTSQEEKVKKETQVRPEEKVTGNMSEKKVTEQGKSSAEASAKEGVQKDAGKAPASKPVNPQGAKPATQQQGAKTPQNQGQAKMNRPLKRSNVIIVSGHNTSSPASNNGNRYNEQRRPDNRGGNRGPIRPRENMVDRAGAIANRREAEERARQEQLRIEQERLERERLQAEEREKAELAKAEEAVSEKKSGESAAAVKENPAEQRQNRPTGNAPRPGQGAFSGNSGRPQGQGSFNRPGQGQGNRPGQGAYNGGGQRQGQQASGRPGQGGAFSRPGQQAGGRPEQGGAASYGRGGQGGMQSGAGRGTGRNGGGFSAPAAETNERNRRNKHSEKDRDRESRRDSIYEDEEMTKGRSNAGRFIKPVAKKVEVQEDEIKTIILPDKITVKELAEKMRVQPSEIVKKLFMQGEMVTVNQEISFEKAEEIALDYEIMCEHEVKEDVIANLLKDEEDDVNKMVPRPPVICVMGHVDHGKTSLLDAIRKTSVTSHEAGGITQHIGAYMVKANDRQITFLDTPGHEAFTAMRMRGANSTDIAILVVAADDGVMPQTIEAINHAKAAGIEIIVAVNKIDKPGANIDRVKQELTEYELVAEDWGGSTIFVPVSAKTGEGIEDLLEMILLTADVQELKADPKRKARGLVIEAQLDKGRGPVATVLVQKGTLHVGDFVSAGATHGKVRAMVDDKGRRVREALPSTPVEILGLNDVPNAGEIFICHDSEKEAKSFADTFIAQNKEKLLEDTKTKMSLDDLFSKIKEGNLKELNLIIKADVQGSVEAVRQSLTKLSNEEVVVKVIHGGVGAINESDVVLASASNAIIIGFNVRPDAVAKQTAEHEGVDIRLYKVIYQAIEDVEAAMKGMLDPVFEEKIIGHAEVRQIFKASAVGNIAGAFVLDGEFRRDCKIRITREGEQIYEGSLASLKRFKDDVKEVKAGYECGLVFEGFDRMQELDLVEAYIMVEVPR